MDLSELSVEDLNNIAAKKWDNVSAQGLQSYQSHLQQKNQAMQQAQSPQQIPDAADKAAQGGKQDAQPTGNSSLMSYLKKGAEGYAKYMGGVVSGGINGLTLGNYDPLPKLRQGGGAAGVGGAVGNFVGGVETGSGLAALAGPAAGVAGRVAQNVGIGAALGGLSKPSDGGDRTTDALVGGATGGAIGGAVEAAGPMLGKGADWLQQKAMGLKKYLSGVGTAAIEQGVRGTKATMADQVGNAIEGIGDHAGEAIGKLGRIDSAEAAKPLNDYASSLAPADMVPEHSAAQYAGATGRGEAIASRGEVDAPDAWALARAAGKAGFRAQKALQSEPAYLAQLEQQGYSNAIKAAYEKQNPGLTNDVADDFAKMSKLYKAQSALNQPEAVGKGLPFKQMMAATAGAGVGGPAGALGGVALSKLSESPVLQSYAAHGLSLLGKGADNLANPAVLQGLFGGAVSPNKQQ